VKYEQKEPLSIDCHITVWWGEEGGGVGAAEGITNILQKKGKKLGDGCGNRKAARPVVLGGRRKG